MINRKSTSRILLLILGVAVIGAACSFFASDAQALRITLKRVTFEGPKRTEVLTIINNEAKPKTYRMGWRHMKMVPNKALTYVEDPSADPDIKPVDDMVRFAPRRVTIPPGGSQQVRLMLRKPRDLPDGEYRSHFWIQPEADATKFTPEGEVDNTRSAVQLRMLTGITIPVIVRSGNLQGTGEITGGGASIKGNNIEVKFTVARKGNKSLYGDIDMICLGGEQTDIRTVRGIAIYPEVDSRDFTFNIPVPADVNSCRQIGITYREPAEAGQDLGRTIAEGVVNLT